MATRTVVQGNGRVRRPPVLVIAGERVFSSGLVSDRPGGLESETHRIFQRAFSMLRDAGISPGDVVRTRAWYVDDPAGAGAEEIRNTHGVVFDHPGPAFSAVRVTCLPEGAAIAIELEAIRGAASRIKRFRSDEMSSISLAVFCDGELWVSGVTGEGESVGEQIGRITGTVRDALSEFGMREVDVVATRHFMRPGARFATSPPEWAAFMSKAIPTSAGIAVESIGDAAMFMLECEAVQDASSGRNNLRSGRSYEGDHNYCRSVRVQGGNVTYVAGTTSLVVGEVVRSEFDVTGQIADTLETVRWSIEQQGMAWSDLLKTRAYVVGGPVKVVEAIAALDEQLAGMDVASTVVGVPTLSKPEVVIEIEATAVSV
jgi:enamine deaminase RidA (YjgF/YER057c/UK114 family)